jgi:hypothetical protein
VSGRTRLLRWYASESLYDFIIVLLIIRPGLFGTGRSLVETG